MAQTVRDVMTPNPVTLPRSATLEDAAIRMRDANIGGVIVADGDNISGVADISAASPNR